MAKSLCNVRRRGLHDLVARFGDDRSGAIAVLFALILAPVLLVIGMSIDYGHATTYQTSMQRVLDETVIAGATTFAKTNDAGKAEAAARRRFDATKPDAYEIVLNVSVDRQSGRVTADATADVPMSFMTIAGYKHLTVNANAIAASKRAPSKRARAADKPARQAASRALSNLSDGKIRDLIYRVEQVCYRLKSSGFANRVPQCRSVFDGSFESRLRSRLASNSDTSDLLPGGVRLVQ